MRHFVLTRSAYGPAWDLEANRRRLAITRAVTARTMAAQSVEWTWIVLLDERDPLAAQRLDLYRSSAPNFIPLWRTADDTDRSRAAAADYRAPWRSLMPADDTVLMTRLDDDDGLAPDALHRYQVAATRDHRRVALMMPLGVRVWGGRYDLVKHERNAMHTLVTPPGDDLCVYDYGHTKVRQRVPVLRVDQRIGWLWVRHRDTLSDWRRARRPLSPFVRGWFPVDWAALERAWAN